MLRLDVGTMGFSAAIVSLAAALIIAGYGGQARSRRPWMFFCLSALGYGIGVIAILFRGGLPPWLAVLGGNLLVMGSALAFHAGVCLLAGRRLTSAFYTAMILAYLVGYSFYFYVDDNINARIAVISLLRVPVFVHAALLLHRGRSTRASQGELLLEAVAWVWAVLLVLRSLGSLFAESPIHSFAGLIGVQAIYFAASGLGNVLIAIGVLRLDTEKNLLRLQAMVAEKTHALEQQIEEHAVARQMIKTQLAFQDALFDTLPIPVFARDRNGAFVTCNKAYEAFFGISKADLVGRTAMDMFRPDLASAYMEADRKVLTEQRSITYETNLIRADGAERRAVTDKACYRDAEGNVAGIIATTVDITEQVRATADLRAILDNMTDVFYRTDADGRLLMLSRSVEIVLGYTVEELLGTKTETLHVNPGEREAMLAAMSAGEGSITDFEICLRHKSGKPLWFSISARFYQDDHGDRAGTEGVVRLIEERKRAEMNLQESRSLIRALLNASTDAIMLLRGDGILLAVNEVMAGRFGKTADQLAGTCLWDLFPPDVAQERRQATRDVLESGVAIHTYDRRGDLYLYNSIYPVPAPEGFATNLAVYSRDITDQKLAEAKIIEYVGEVERSNAELEQFAYVASHDLREPLRMISSYLSLLERRYGGLLDQDGLDFLRFARDGAQRMDRLVLDLLELSRIERKGAPIVAMSALPVITLTLRNLDPAITEAGGLVMVDAMDPPPMVMGDADQISQLFQNLIGNALKYRSKNRRPQIKVHILRRDSDWEFQIADNGIGIQEEYFERIFRIFQRLHNREEYDGTGIGLAICKKIVERHGGRIWVSSTPGEGSVFSFTLPAAV